MKTTRFLVVSLLALLTPGLMYAQGNDEKKTVTVELPQWVKNIKFSGYGMLQYQAQDPYTVAKDADGKVVTDANGNPVAHKNASNSYSVRLLRMMLDGKIGDVAWRAQMQGSGSSAYMVDLYAEWQKYQALRVKVGQFKRAFTFESPTNPIDQGFYSYGLVINNLVGYGDRTGEKSMGGRDIGIQLQGDVLKNKDGRALLHYQVGVYNGEGINTKDADNRKDVIGGVWVMPVKGLRLGAFGWTGSRAGIGEKNRYALSAEYMKNDWTFRTEYIHSQGAAANKALGDKADGVYAFAIAPVVAKKLYAKARYNMYRPSKEWSSSKTMYEVGFNYLFNKNLQLNMEYARVNDRTIVLADKHNYNFLDVQLDFRF